MTNEALKKLAEEIINSDAGAHDEMCVGKSGKLYCSCAEIVLSALQKVRDETIEECAMLCEKQKEYRPIGQEFLMHPSDVLNFISDSIRALKEKKE